MVFKVITRAAATSFDPMTAAALDAQHRRYVSFAAAAAAGHPFLTGGYMTSGNGGNQGVYGTHHSHGMTDYGGQHQLGAAATTAFTATTVFAARHFGPGPRGKPKARTAASKLWVEKLDFHYKCNLSNFSLQNTVPTN